MKKLLDLHDHYYSILSQSEMIATEIGNILDEEFEYNGIVCKVTQYDIDDDLIWFESVDGRWISNSGGEKKVLTFKQFSKLLDGN